MWGSEWGNGYKYGAVRSYMLKQFQKVDMFVVPPVFITFA